VTQAPTNKSDLPTRTVSAVVMLALAGTALWLGGGIWAIFVGLIAAGVLLEFSRLVLAFTPGLLARLAWHLGGLIYVGLACAALIFLRVPPVGYRFVLMVVCGVVATDIFAYFAGRTFRGPKVAPRISPSKTWSGLAGGVVGSTLVFTLLFRFPESCRDCVAVQAWRYAFEYAIRIGPLVAIIAQAGDFFESWLKRRAGVKDSGTLIPGHGGLFDRVDGLLAVCFIIGLVMLGTVFESLLPGPA